jgi:hypothetical protein
MSAASCATWARPWVAGRMWPNCVEPGSNRSVRRRCTRWPIWKRSPPRGCDALDALLLPIEAGLVGLRTFQLDPDQARRLGQGQLLPWPPVPLGEGVAYDGEGRALGLVALTEAGLRPKRLFKRGFAAGLA